MEKNERKEKIVCRSNERKLREILGKEKKEELNESARMKGKQRDEKRQEKSGKERNE